MGVGTAVGEEMGTGVAVAGGVAVAVGAGVDSVTVRVGVTSRSTSETQAATTNKRANNPKVTRIGARFTKQSPCQLCSASLI